MGWPYLVPPLAPLKRRLLAAWSCDVSRPGAFDGVRTLGGWVVDGVRMSDVGVVEESASSRWCGPERSTAVFSKNCRCVDGVVGTDPFATLTERMVSE